jgi:hypothetical protein
MAQVVLWFFVAVFGCLGLLALFSPAGSRRIVTVFLTKAPARVLGAGLMVAGALVFRAAQQTGFELVVKGVGFAMFMAGGVHLILPTVAIVINEWWVARRDIWVRLSGVAYMVLAGLLYMASRTISVVEEVAEEVLVNGGAP